MENEKYQTQLDSLRDSKLDGQIKQKKEIDHLRNELRKARIRLEHILYIGMPQDSSFEWKSESQIKFLDENPCTHAVLGALCDTIRFF